MFNKTNNKINQLVFCVPSSGLSEQNRIKLLRQDFKKIQKNLLFPKNIYWSMEAFLFGTWIEKWMRYFFNPVHVYKFWYSDNSTVVIGIVQRKTWEKMGTCSHSNLTKCGHFGNKEWVLKQWGQKISLLTHFLFTRLVTATSF